MGIPLKFNAITAIKYASVQIMLSYSSPRPDFIWVPVEDELGESELVKVSFIYPQLPYSCSHCKAFGHSFSRCIHNPSVVKPVPRPRHEGGAPVTAKSHKVNHVSRTKSPSLAPTSTDKEPGEFNPEVVRVFLGCDVVMDDQVLQDVVNNDDLEAFDTVADITPNAPAMPTATVSLPALEMEPPAPAAPAAQTKEPCIITTESPVQFGTLEQNGDPTEAPQVEPLIEPLVPITTSMSRSPVNQKRRRGKSNDVMAPSAAVTTPTRPVVIGLGASAPMPPKTKAIVDEDGFTQVTYKKSPRLALRPTILKRLQ